MFKNYFITSIRNFWRNKIFFSINVLGLSIGISAALVIFLIVYYEFSFDKFEKDGDQVYRVVMDMKFDGNDGHSAAVPAPLGNAIQSEVTGVDLTVPVFQFQGDATAKVSIAKEGSDKPTVFKNQPDIVFTNPQYFYLLALSMDIRFSKNIFAKPFLCGAYRKQGKTIFSFVAASRYNRQEDKLQ